MPMTKAEFLDMVESKRQIALNAGMKIFYVRPASAILSDEICQCITLGGCPSRVDDVSIDDELISDLPEYIQYIVRYWIDCHFEYTKTVNRRRDSYGLKHLLEADTGIYLTNNQFKSACLEVGWNPSNEHDLNWQFHISEKTLKQPYPEWKNIFNTPEYNLWIEQKGV